MTQPQQPPTVLTAITVVKGTVDEVETEAISHTVDHRRRVRCRRSGATANTTRPGDRLRSARTHAKGLWGTGGVLRGVSNFNPTGFRG